MLTIQIAVLYTTREGKLWPSSYTQRVDLLHVSSSGDATNPTPLGVLLTLVMRATLSLAFMEGWGVLGSVIQI